MSVEIMLLSAIVGIIAGALVGKQTARRESKTKKPKYKPDDKVKIKGIDGIHEVVNVWGYTYGSLRSPTEPEFQYSEDFYYHVGAFYAMVIEEKHLRSAK